MTTLFLRNTWYLGAWSSEIVVGKPIGRTLLESPILFFRTADGAVNAIDDTCPHRFAPLSLGEQRGDTIRCIYHGLEFDRTGACVRNPHGNKHIPAGAHLRSYPVEERFEGVWIWMGDAAKADPASIPDLGWELDPEEGMSVQRGLIPVAANYQLLSDNIMDLSHIEYLHAGSLGTPAVGAAEVEVERDGDTVWCRRRIANDVVTPGLAVLLGTAGEVVDRYLDAHWIAPNINKNNIYFTSPGAPKTSGSRMTGAHIFTPETAASTHYFLTAKAPASGAPPVMPEGTKDPITEEDKPMLEAIQGRMKDRDFWSMKPVLLSVDAAAVLSRRILQQKISEEQKDASAAA
jgi:phenylpropionate dioxygenase-like ring-hydroxylating dioxygenase large terminal subunit